MGTGKTTAFMFTLLSIIRGRKISGIPNKVALVLPSIPTAVLSHQSICRMNHTMPKRLKIGKKIDGEQDNGDI